MLLHLLNGTPPVHLCLQIAAAVSEVQRKGFINYFGLQRFGTGSVPTHRWGLAVMV